MQRQNILQTVLFIVFFSIGAAALGLSIIAEELLQYYRNRQLLTQAQASLDRLESLNADYDALLERLHKEPDIVKHIAPATLGKKPVGKDTIYPNATVEQLAAAKKVLTEDLSQQAGASETPEWIMRCSEPGRRFALFVAGAFLVIISFVLFGSTERRNL